MAERLVADVAVIGAGPAGIAAAVSASALGKRVLLLDSAPRPGGQIWRHRRPVELPRRARRWLARLAESGAQFEGRIAVIDATAGQGLTGERDGTTIDIDAKAFVLATGATELLLPFPGWTEPGVVGVGGLQALIKEGLELRGRRVLIAGTGPLLLAAASAAVTAGAAIVAVAEQTTRRRLARFAGGLWREPSLIAQAAAYRSSFVGAPYLTGTWVSGVVRRGDELVATLTGGRRQRPERCDMIAVGYGLVPSLELAQLFGCRIESGRVHIDATMQTSVPGVYAAGEATGIAGAASALRQGGLAGAAAAGRPGRLSARRSAERLERAFALRDELRSVADSSTIVCRCEDVRLGEIAPDWDARQRRLYTRAGMGPCQGRVCGPALAFIRGSGGGDARVPILPTPVGALARGDDRATHTTGGH